MPGREHQATKKAEEVATKTGATVDREVRSIRIVLGAGPTDACISQVDYARNKFTEAEKNAEKLAAEGRQKFDQVRKEAGKELHETVASFDKTVERKTAEAKSGLSSWFGIGK